jgi:hypothetical protein
MTKNATDLQFWLPIPITNYKSANSLFRLGNNAAWHLHWWGWAHDRRSSYWSSLDSAHSQYHTRVQILHLVLWHFLRQTQRCQKLGYLRACLSTPCKRWRWNRNQTAFADFCALLHKKGYYTAKVLKRIHEADVRLECFFGSVHYWLACREASEERQKVRALRS